MKHKLVLHKDWKTLQYWNNTLCRMLIDSNLFDVDVEDQPLIRFPGTRNGNFHQMRVNGKMVGCDTWDTTDPLGVYARSGYFKKPDGPAAHLDLIIKIQSLHNDAHWNKVSSEIGVPIKPWTIFPSSFFPLGFFKWQFKESFKYTCSLTGKNNRFGRRPWVDWCTTQPDFYTKADYVSTDKLEVFEDVMKNCKWGISLSGRRGAFKNRRECELASCGMPIAMNYEPSYAFEFKAGKHFVLLNKPEDLITLRDIDPRPFAEAATQIYNDHFSPVGMANHLIKMVSEL